MNFFEFELQKYERRIKRIKENPDPKMLKCNELLYEIYYDQRKQWLKNWQEGKPFVYCQGTEGLLMNALGITAMSLSTLGDRATGEWTAKYLNIARSRGFPQDQCDRVAIQAGMGLSEDIPAPNFATCYVGDCGPSMQSIRWVMRDRGVASFPIDLNNYDQSLEGLRYMAEQFRELIRSCEREVPGAKYDEATLVRLHKDVEACEGYMDEIMEMLKFVPSPLGGRDALRMPPMDVDDPRLPEYFKMLAEELRERADKGIGALQEERIRVCWLCSAPFYADLFSFCEDRGCAIPLYEEGAGFSLGRRASQRRNYDVELSPLEVEALRWSTSHWSGPAERRVAEILWRCREYHIDGIVSFLMPGCVTCNCSAQIIADRAESELGIPTLMLQGRCQDSAQYSQAQSEAALEEFISLCLDRKAARGVK